MMERSSISFLPALARFKMVATARRCPDAAARRPYPIMSHRRKYRKGGILDLAAAGSCGLPGRVRSLKADHDRGSAGESRNCVGLFLIFSAASPAARHHIAAKTPESLQAIVTGPGDAKSIGFRNPESGIVQSREQSPRRLGFFSRNFNRIGRFFTGKNERGRNGQIQRMQTGAAQAGNHSFCGAPRFRH